MSFLVFILRYSSSELLCLCSSVMPSGTRLFLTFCSATLSSYMGFFLSILPYNHKKSCASSWAENRRKAQGQRYFSPSETLPLLLKKQLSQEFLPASHLVILPQLLGSLKSRILLPGQIVTLIRIGVFLVRRRK